MLPGDRIPVDGVVVHGRSTVEEAAFTGEPLPVTKQSGDTVSAGTINCDGALVVEVGIQVNSRTHVPQKLTGLISLSTNPVSTLSFPIQNRPLKPLIPLIGLWQGLFGGP